MGIAASGPLVGRVAELAVLDEAIRRAVAGSVQVVALSGEGGIGKSRLASEGLRSARARGFRTLEGAAGQLQKDLSFAPIVEALRPLVAEAALVDGLSDLVRLFDGLRVPKPVSLGDTRLERTRMFEAARLLIERACNRLPVAILIDDVHWADRGIARNEESVLVGEDLLRLLMAIQMCWGNLVAVRASAEEGIRLARPPEPSRKRLAVLVQPMVAGTAAAVAFPANPATGERNRVLIDAIAGLGEQPALCAATPEGSFQETSSRASRCSFRPHHDPHLLRLSGG